MGFVSSTPLLARRGVFFLLLLAVPLQALAQGREDDRPAVDIGEIDVRGRANYESIEDASAFTTVIKPTDFDRQMKSAPEILSQTAGVDVTNLGGEGQLSTVSIRGSSAEQVAVFIDGVRMNSALTGAVDFSTVPIDSIDRIEVIRGSASAKFGTDAMGGVINIITKKAGAKRAIDLSLSGGSFETLRTSESWREPREGWEAVLAHRHFSSGGDFTFRSAEVSFAGQVIGAPRTYTRIHNASISEDVLTKFGFDLSETAHLSFSNDFFWTDRQIPGTEEETTLLYPANPLEANEEIFRNTAGLKFVLDRFFISDLSWEAGVSYVMNWDHFADQSPAIGDPIDVTNITHAPEGYLSWTHAAKWRHVGLASTLRYQCRYDRSSDRSPIEGSRLMGVHGRYTNAVFIDEELSLLEDSLLIAPQGRFEKASDRETRAGWKVGMVGRPVRWIDLKVNVQSAFRYPTFNELYFPDQGYLRGNPLLEDERSIDWDIGFVFHPKYVSLELSYFRNRVDNQIIFVPISAVTIQPLNTFRVDTQGVEVTASIDPIKQLHLAANYTWLDAHFAGSGLVLPGRPSHKANFRAEGRIKPVTIFAELQRVNSFPVNMANTVSISGHTAINVGTTLAFAKHFFATVEVKDIMNVQIYDARGFPLPRRSWWVTVGARA